MSDDQTSLTGYRRIVPVPSEIAEELASVTTRMDADRRRRDELIVEAHARGASLREIERVSGVTHVGVMKIIRRASE